MKIRLLLSFLSLAFLGVAQGVSASDSKLIKEGKVQFEKECAMCHEGFNTAVIMLGKRLGKENALLSQRKGLSADYVKYIVRNGILGMPAITRVEVTEEQLESIAAYLSRNP